MILIVFCSGIRSDISGGLYLSRGGGGWEGQPLRLSRNRGEVEAERPGKDSRALSVSGEENFDSYQSTFYDVASNYCLSRRSKSTREKNFSWMFFQAHWEPPPHIEVNIDLSNIENKVVKCATKTKEKFPKLCVAELLWYCRIIFAVMFIKGAHFHKTRYLRNLLSNIVQCQRNSEFVENFKGSRCYVCGWFSNSVFSVIAIWISK